MGSYKDEKAKGLEIHNGSYKNTEEISSRVVGVLRDMETQVEHFGADFEQLKVMILNVVEDPDSRDYLISQAAILTY